MRLVLIYIVIGFIFITSNWLGSVPYKLSDKPLVYEQNLPQAQAESKPERSLVSLPTTEPKRISKPKLLKVITQNHSNKIALMKISFEQLPGWSEADFKKSLLAFQTSCKAFFKQTPTQSVGTQHINLQAKDWYPACTAASLLNSFSEIKAKKFFEQWFHPIQFNYKKPIHSLFTGYYMPQLKGSLVKTKQYNTPIYGLPHDKHARRRIAAPVLAWIQNSLERTSLKIEGSGIIELTNGKRLYLNYAGKNRASYTSSAIFQSLKQPGALGVKGIALTPGYSLAIDKKWIPLGAPLWVVTQKPRKQKQEKHQSKQPFKRLMIAQDIGGAIRGLMRGDIYWGASKNANFLGENMKDTGQYWLLLPKHILNKIS